MPNLPNRSKRMGLPRYLLAIPIETENQTGGEAKINRKQNPTLLNHLRRLISLQQKVLEEIQKSQKRSEGTIAEGETPALRKTAARMNKTISRKDIALFLVVGWLLFSCDSRRVYEDYRDFEDGAWNLEEAVSFDIIGIQPQSTIPVVAIRYTDRYEFNNLYVRFVQEDSTASILQDTLVNIGLFDPKSGKPMGKGFGNLHTVYDTLLGDGKISPHTAQVTIWQYMRKEQLEGIESVGIKLLVDK